MIIATHMPPELEAGRSSCPLMGLEGFEVGSFSFLLIGISEMALRTLGIACDAECKQFSRSKKGAANQIRRFLGN